MKNMTDYKARVFWITETDMYLFPFTRLPLPTYNKELSWRCWDAEPDIDTVCDTDWAAA